MSNTATICNAHLEPKIREIKDLNRASCVHKIPENNFGFICYHTKDGEKINDEKGLQTFLNDILGPVTEDINKESIAYIERHMS